ncbi:MAG: hypothetical protein R3B07_23320 [Polyangiaceae bacterium]
MRKLEQAKAAIEEDGLTSDDSDIDEVSSALKAGSSRRLTTATTVGFFY